jgi:hypothetical protein
VLAAGRAGVDVCHVVGFLLDARMSDAIRDDELTPVDPPVPRGNPDMPDLRHWGGLRTTKKALRRSATIMANREAIAYELLAMASTKITDILNWDEDGNVSVIPSKRIDHRHARMIKKVKKTTFTNKDGETTSQFEIELFDKVSTLRLLAQAAGLLAKDTEDDKPSVVGMKILRKKRKPKTLENKA